jgi:hypothetical protein
MKSFDILNSKSDSSRFDGMFFGKNNQRNRVLSDHQHGGQLLQRKQSLVIKDEEEKENGYIGQSPKRASSESFGIPIDRINNSKNISD